MMCDERLAAEIGGEFDHILVDEYQDTNVLQAEILKNLRRSGDGVTVVGDDAQAIYSFRAATVDNILGFPDQYVPENGLPASVITLEENYRSTQGVLDAANALMAEGTGSTARCCGRPRAPVIRRTTSRSPTTRRRPTMSSRAFWRRARAACRSSARRCCSEAPTTATRSSWS